MAETERSLIALRAPTFGAGTSAIITSDAQRNLLAATASISTNISALVTQQASIAASIAPAVRAIAQMQTDIVKTMAPVIVNLNGPLIGMQKAIGESYLASAVQISDVMASAVQISDVMTTVAKQINFIVPPMIDFGATLSPLAALLAEAGESLRGALPPNWPRKVKWEVVQRLVNEGLPLVWVPGAAIVKQLLEAPDDDTRRTILTVNAEAILDDLLACLDELDDFPALATHVIHVRESIASFRSGNFRAGQALAATTLTDLVEAHLGGAYSIRRVTPFDDDTPFVTTKRVAALSPIRPALEHFDRGREPESYNRHASVHTVATNQYTWHNSLVALMLVTSVARTVMDDQQAKVA